MREIDLVVFDLDGTLLDTIEDLGDSVNEVLCSRNLPEHSYDEYCLFIGDGMDKLIRRSLPPHLSDDSVLVGEVLEAYQAAYLRNWNKKSRPYEGIVNCVKRLSSADIKSAILSNKPHKFTEMCASELLSELKFEKVLGQREGVPRKPDPGPALGIAKGLGVPAERAMFVGDTDVDIFTGLSAGMLTVGVLWGFRDEEELRGSGAEHIVSHPDQILELIGISS